MTRWNSSKSAVAVARLFRQNGGSEALFWSLPLRDFLLPVCSSSMLTPKPLFTLLCCFIAFGFIAAGRTMADTPETPTESETPAATDAPAATAGHPAEQLPKHIQRLTWFGQQPVWSRDGEKIYFLSKAFGDVFEFDLKTKTMRPLTTHFQHHGFTQVRVLANGRLLLSGPKATFDRTNAVDRKSAVDHCWLSILDPAANEPPIALNIASSGTPAVSRKKMRIAWTVLWPQAPELLKEGESQIFVADLVEKEGGYEIADKKMVVDSRNLPFTMHSLEVTDFRPADESELLFTVFQFQGTEVFGVDLESGKTVNYSNNPEQFNAAANVFPDGKSIAVETARHEGNPWPLVDIHRLLLDGATQSERMTYFGAFRGYEATRPAIHPDGNSMCFQIGKAGDERDAGHGLFLYDIKNAPKSED